MKCCIVSFRSETQHLWTEKKYILFSFSAQRPEGYGKGIMKVKAFKGTITSKLKSPIQETGFFCFQFVHSTLYATNQGRFFFFSFLSFFFLVICATEL